MMRSRTIFIAILFSIFPISFASADDATPVLREIDLLWVAIATGLVALMQVGFLLLECGIVRSKTTINVAQKNLADFAVSVMLFWLIGFTVMFGASAWGIIGFSSEYIAMDRPDTWTIAFFVFQAMFCGTAATIVSGAVSERATFVGYFMVAAVTAVLIYPVMGHWAWGGLLDSSNETWLAALGFMDFAGSTVVHGTGAWIALAAIMVIGPRIGRFSSDGRVHLIVGHSPVLSGAGAILLLVGWIGFNGGSALSVGTGLPGIIAATIVGGMGGAISGAIYGRIADAPFLPVERSINGLLGGLVGVTAGPDVLGMQGAFAIGLLGGLAANWGNDFVLNRLKLDDVVGAIGVHGFAGAAGTIALPLFIPADALLAGGRLAQLGVQTVGVVACFVWAFGATWLVMKLLGRVLHFRVTADEEATGLNSVEHGVTLGTGLLQQKMLEMLENDDQGGDNILNVEHGDECAEVTELFNLLSLRDAADSETRALMAQRELMDTQKRARNDAVIVDKIQAAVTKAARGDFGDRLNVTHKNEVLASVCGGLNTLFDSVEVVMTDLRKAMDHLAHGNLTFEMPPSDGGFGEIATNYNHSVDKLRVQREDTNSAVSEMTLDSRNTAGHAVEALSDIEKASHEALAIVSIIDGIASKTNILALNASIEATRAGEHGAAFSVVAEQVRQLAGRVTEASSEINEVISRNRDLVSSGTTAVTEVQHALHRIEDRLLALTAEEAPTSSGVSNAA